MMSLGWQCWPLLAVLPVAAGLVFQSLLIGQRNSDGGLATDTHERQLPAYKDSLPLLDDVCADASTTEVRPAIELLICCGKLGIVNLFKLAWRAASSGGGAVAYFRVNVALHCLNCAGVFLLTAAHLEPSSVQEGSSDGLQVAASDRQQHRKVCWYFCAMLSAVLFTVHPLRAEVLCWDACQPYLLAALLTLLALRAQTGSRLSSSLFAAALLAVAILAKTVTVPVVAVVLVFEFQRLLPSAQTRVTWSQAVLFVGLAIRRSLCVLCVLPAGSWWAAAHAPSSTAGPGDLLPLSSWLFKTAYALCAYPTLTLGALVRDVGALSEGSTLHMRHKAQAESLRIIDSQHGGYNLELMVAVGFVGMVMLWLYMQLLMLGLPGPGIEAYKLKAISLICCYAALVLPTTGLFFAQQHNEEPVMMIADRYSYLPAMLLGVPLGAHLLYSVGSRIILFIEHAAATKTPLQTKDYIGLYLCLVSVPGCVCLLVRTGSQTHAITGEWCTSQTCNAQV